MYLGRWRAFRSAVEACNSACLHLLRLWPHQDRRRICEQKIARDSLIRPRLAIGLSSMRYGSHAARSPFRARFEASLVRPRARARARLACGRNKFFNLSFNLSFLSRIDRGTRRYKALLECALKKWTFYLLGICSLRNLYDEFSLSQQQNDICRATCVRCSDTDTDRVRFAPGESNFST